MGDKWRERRWGNLASLEYGKSLRGYQSDDGPYAVYGTNGRIGSCSAALCPHGGVVIGRKGAYRGVHYSDKPFFVIDTAFWLKPKVEMNMRWAYYELLTHDINSMDSGSAIPSTSRDDFYALPVYVPPLPEQRAIAHILGTLDDKIDLNRRMNETLEAIARAIFKSWFVDFDPVRAKAEGRDPPGMDAETAALFPDSFEDSALGKMPTGWSVEHIGDVVRCVGGSTPSTKESGFWDGSISFATPRDLASLSAPVLLTTERTITERGLQQISSGLLPSGTVLLSSRAPIGYLAIAEVPVAVNQGFIAMVCDRQLPNYYVLQWARQNMDTIIANANGTTFLEISKSSFRPINVVVPSAKLLDRFSALAEPVYRRIVANLQESVTLATIRDALLPKLMSGEIRVKDAERFLTEFVL